MGKETHQVHELMKLKAEQVRNGAQILLDVTVDWQVIKEFLSNRHEEMELTAMQEEKLKRYKYVYDQLSSGRYTKAQVISQLMNEKIFGLSMSQAYEDIRCATEIFTYVTPPKKQFELNNRYEVSKAAHAKCMEIHDFKNAAAYEKIIQGYIDMMPEEEEQPGWDFEGHKLEGVFDPALLGGPKVDMAEVLKLINSKRKVAINVDMFEHLNSEDVSKEDPL